MGREKAGIMVNFQDWGAEDGEANCLGEGHQRLLGIRDSRMGLGSEYDPDRTVTYAWGIPLCKMGPRLLWPSRPQRDISFVPLPPGLMWTLLRFL